MRYLAVLLLAMTLALSETQVLGADKVVSRTDALQAIAVFQKDPSSKDGFAAAASILSYAKTTDTVHITLSKAVVPWVKNQDVSDADTRSILLTAYVAGNVLSQLKNGKSQDDVYSGWQQVLSTYAQLLQINSAAKISEVEELKAKEADGKLRAYAAEVQAK